MTDPLDPDEETLITPSPSLRSGSGKQILRPPHLADGALLAGRFRIVRFIARGGMGEVYEAEDGVLHERVALKTIRPDMAADSRAMERFLREVHLARSVTHPNVCRIFDVFEHEGIAFLTMELLGGETLADRLRQSGKMRTEEALPFVEQMAAALDAAHEAGVIHRDFKSGNVMLVPDDRRAKGFRVVVTDFGLARRTRSGGRSASPLTETEAVLGTPDTMAPEQIEGREVSAATDVYALGVVLYEMVTGDLPFHGDTPLSIALKKLKERAPSPRREAPDLPEAWEGTILRCLERAPNDRFASARDAVRSLQGERIASGPGARARRLRLFAAVAAAILLAAGAAYLATRPRTPSRASGGAAPAARPRRAIAVLGFRNLAGRPEEAWVSTALAEMLTTELAAGEKLRAIPSEDVARMKVDLALPEADTLGRETLERIHRRAGADLVLVGSFLAAGGAAGPLRIDLRLQDANAGETIALVSEKGMLSDLDAVASRAGERLRSKLELPAVSRAEAAAVRAAIPANPEAARLYAEGLERMRHFDDVAARKLLETAVKADPGHALAHSALAAVWSRLGYDGKALAEAKSAFDLSAALSRETRLLIEARYRAMHNEWERAIEINRSLFTFFPDNLDYGVQLAEAQTRGGRPKDAIATLQYLREAAKPAGDPRIDVAEAHAAQALSDYPRMRAAALHAEAAGETTGARLLAASARLLEAIALRNLGDAKAAGEACADARARFEAAGDRGGAAMALNNLANSLYDLGNLAGARRAYEQALAACREIGNRRTEAGALDNIANVVGDQGDFAGARALSEQALAIYREIGDKAGAAQTLDNMGTALVLQGDLAGARRRFEEAIPLYRETGDEGGLAIALNNVGEMQADQDDLAAARGNFEKSLEIFRKSGQRGKTAYPALGIAGILIETGELDEAGKRLEETVRICREAGDRHEEAFALSGLGRVALEEDRLDDARRFYEQAGKIRADLGESGAQEESRLDRARVRLEGGDATEAETQARTAAGALRRQKLPDDEAIAWALSARAQLSRGRLDDARRSIEAARPLAQRSQHAGVRRAYALAAARVRAAGGDEDAARRMLEPEIARARERGLVAAELEARPDLAEIEAKPGGGAAADRRLRLDALERDARARRFLLIARRAARARS